MYFLPYNKNLREFSRELRNHSTLSEVLLWQKLRAGQFRGYTFNRQKPLGNFIVDFYCKKLNLVIEIDGGSHFYEEAVIEDQQRQKVLEEMGLAFLRFLDSDVRKSMPFVLAELGYFIEDWEKREINRSLI
jgi:very-short-patch-repair endonuclease